LLSYDKYISKLNEALGVPNFIETWVDTFSDIILDKISDWVSELKEDFNRITTPIAIGNGSFDGYSKEIVIPIVNTLLQKLGTNINLSNFKIKLTFFIVPNQIVDLQSFEARFTRELTFKTNALQDPQLDLVIILPYEILDVRKNFYNVLNRYGIVNKIDELLSHELTHMYEFYRNKYDLTSDSILDELLTKMGTHKLSEISEQWKQFLNIVYLSISYEINARVSEINARVRNAYNDSDSFSVEDFRELVYETDAWSEMLKLKYFDAEKFMDSIKFNISNGTIKNIFQLNDVDVDEDEDEDDIKFIVLSYLIWNWSITLKEVVKSWEDNTKDIIQELDLIQNRYIKQVPEEFLNDPLKFFDFFEKKFKRRWSDFNRKVMRLAARYEFD